MKRRLGGLLLCVLMVSLFLPFEAHADMGPKPSVNISFENMGEELCYGTLLSRTDSTGPYSAWDGTEEGKVLEQRFPEEIWTAFAAYEDPDGYYFLQTGWLCSETKELSWTYYPPSEFKILLYYPETGTFVTSEAYERYAFDSYYTVNMAGVEPEGEGLIRLRLLARRSYDYTWEAVSLLCRIVITILLELLVAAGFGFREKKQLLLILAVNAVTQITLNVLLNVINYDQGGLAFMLFYVLFELVVVVMEAVAFSIFLRRISEENVPRWKPVVYGLTANTLSFAGGWLVARWVPGIF